MNANSMEGAVLPSSVTPAAAATARPGRVPVGIMAGILLFCGALTLVPAYAWFPVLRPAEELMIPTPPPEIALAREAALSRCRLLNSLMVMSLFAVTAGGGLAAAAAARRQVGATVVMSGLKGAVLAAVFAAVGVLCAHVLLDYIKVDPTVFMYRTMGAQAVLMSLVGAGLGMAMGVGVGRPSAVAAFTGRGAMAGILAALLYLLATGIFLTSSQSDYLIPGGVLEGGKDLPLLLSWLGALIIGLVILLPMAYRNLPQSATSVDPPASDER
jgi:hypothetical protein